MLGQKGIGMGVNDNDLPEDNTSDTDNEDEVAWDEVAVNELIDDWNEVMESYEQGKNVTKNDIGNMTKFLIFILDNKPETIFGAKYFKDKNVKKMIIEIRNKLNEDKMGFVLSVYNLATKIREEIKMLNQLKSTTKLVIGDIQKIEFVKYNNIINKVNEMKTKTDQKDIDAVGADILEIYNDTKKKVETMTNSMRDKAEAQAKAEALKGVNDKIYTAISGEDIKKSLKHIKFKGENLFEHDDVDKLNLEQLKGVSEKNLWMQEILPIAFNNISYAEAFMGSWDYFVDVLENRFAGSSSHYRKLKDMVEILDVKIVKLENAVKSTTGTAQANHRTDKSTQEDERNEQKRQLNEEIKKITDNVSKEILATTTKEFVENIILFVNYMIKYAEGGEKLKLRTIRDNTFARFLKTPHDKTLEKFGNNFINLQNINMLRKKKENERKKWEQERADAFNKENERQLKEQAERLEQKKKGDERKRG